MEIPPERVGVRCEGLRVRGGEAFRACGDVEAVWPADGWPFFLRIGPGAPGRPVVPGERMPQLATSAGWQGPVPRGAPLDSKVRASLKPSGTAPDCEAPPLPAGAQALVPDGAYVDPEGAPAVLAGVYGAAPVLQSDVDLTGDNALDRVLSIEDGARAWWFLLARSPDGDVRAWPIVGSTNLRASWATPYTYKGGRYVAISGALDGACVLRTLRWGANGPTFEIADPR